MMSLFEMAEISCFFSAILIQSDGNQMVFDDDDNDYYYY